MKNIKILGLALVGLALAGCSTFSISTRQNTAYQIAKDAGFKPFSFQTQRFRLAGFYKLSGKTKTAAIYIEGDGFAWIDRYTVSHNPTPRNPMGLRLAVLDVSSNVFYIARPCQFVDLDKEQYCDQKYWTNYRFSTTVLQSYNEILDKIKNSSKIDDFNIVGFSGGGAIAALLASQRDDIKSLRTIAGNLDHVALNAKRNVSALNGSLNPIAFASRTKNVPQILYSGSDDKTVPGWVALSFAKAENNPKCVHNVIAPNVDHMKGWLSFWRLENAKIPTCQ